MNYETVPRDLKYQDSNALLALCFEHVDIKWYHLLTPAPLEFGRVVNYLVLLVSISTQMRNRRLVQTKSDCAIDESVMSANAFSEWNFNKSWFPLHDKRHDHDTKTKRL